MSTSKEITPTHLEILSDAEVQALLEWMAQGARPQVERVWRYWRNCTIGQRQDLTARLRAELDRRLGGAPGERYPADEG